MRPLLRSISGVAEINSTGGYVKQYETLVDPQKLRYYNLTIQDVRNALAHNNANAGGGILPQHAEQYLIRSVGLVRDLDDIRGIVLKESGATPIYIRDVAEVRFGTEVRYWSHDQKRLHRIRRRSCPDDDRRQCQGDRRPREGARC